jgi:hypothetical protein
MSIAASGASSQAGRVALGTLAPGTSGTVAMMLSAPSAPGTYAVIATATTADPEQNTGNNTVTTTLQVRSSSENAATPPPSGPSYYISPTGNDGNSGSQNAPWKTFGFAIPRLVPGDTLVLLDGNYTPANSGRFSANCAASAKNGTASAPITIRAHHERKPFLLSDGLQPVIEIQNCGYWVIEGLYTRQVDNSSPGADGRGFNVRVYSSNHITLRRMLIYGCNRWWNNSALLLENTSDSLVEESEAYFCHRKLFAAGSRNANRNVFRRNYGHGRGAADVCRPNIPGVCGGDTSAGDGNTADGGIQLGYPGSDNIAENNIVEDAYIGIGVDALGPADRNRMYGNIAIKNTFGFLVTSRGAGASRTPHDTVLANNVALASKLLGVYLRGAENTEVSNMMILNTMSSSSGHGLGADHS